MGLDLRLPNITGTTEKEQLTQIKSYLYQFAQQLQWAMNTIETPSVSQQVVNQTSQKVIVQTKEEDAEATFSSLKALIIKSADIVDAYYDEISTRLEGMYVAQSDFGTFMEQTSQEIKQTSTYTDQKFNDVQVIITGEVENLQASVDDTAEKVGGLDSAIGEANKNIDALKAAVIEANAYIRSGLLYYDDNEIPVFGLEIGQKNTVNDVDVFNKYARFTSDRLSFYDQNDSEIAYISDYKLYIRNVEITASFKIGGFIDTVSNGDVVTKWVGGDG